MSPQTLEIIDQSIHYTLISFLVFFSIALFYVTIRMPRQRQGFMMRSTTHSLVLSVVLSVVFFVFVTFTPLPFLENFATAPRLEVTPLRLTALTYERFHEGFSVEGEVWNQTGEPMEDLSVVFKIWGSGRELLEEVSLAVQPTPLPAGSAGTFQLRYAKRSPFLYGYEVFFATQECVVIPHIKGFDVL